MRQPENPWANAANAAIGGLYKNYMTRPNQAEMEKARLSNQLLGSQLQTDALSRENIQSQIGERQFKLDQLRKEQNASSKFAEAFGQIPQVGAVVPADPSQYGPIQPVTQSARNNDIAGIFEQFAPTLSEDRIGAARDALGTAGALRFENPVDRQLALDEKATTYGAYSEGLERDIEADRNKLMSVSPGSHIFDPKSRQSIFNAPTKKGGGSYIQQPDGTIISIDGGVPGKNEVGTTVNNQIQEQQVALEILDQGIGYTVTLAQDNPANFGFQGKAKSKLQDVNMMLNGISKTLGYEEPEQAFNSIVNTEMNKRKKEGDTFEYLNQLYDPNITALEKSRTLLAYQAASALGGQSGRSVSDRDVKQWLDQIGDPQSFFMNQDKFISGMKYLKDQINIRKKVLSATTGGNVTGAGYEEPNPDQFNSNQAPDQQGGLPPEKKARLEYLRAKRDAGTIQ